MVARQMAARDLVVRETAMAHDDDLLGLDHDDNAVASDAGDHAELRALVEERTRAIEQSMGRRTRFRGLGWVACAGLVTAVAVVWYANRAPTTKPLPPLPVAGAPASDVEPLVDQATGIRGVSTPLLAPVQLYATTLAEDIRLREESYERKGVPTRMPKRVLELLRRTP